MTGRGGFAGFDGLDGPEHLRVGDAERDEVAVSLHDHFAQGRLTREELDERLEATLSAKTAGDLRAVTRDLPDPRAGSARSEGPSSAWGGAGHHGFAPHGFAHHGFRHHGGPPRWGRHHHAHHPRFAPLLVALFIVAAIASGPGWAFGTLVKAMLLGWLILAVGGLLFHRLRHRLNDHRGPHALH
ncbi:DUF1707 domain-containing protein [Actinomadura sp. HBU206391]|uniref:DUF1707 SHOCT-like domain-containing protein n=1 Tax=Actinomadura sp. HBU206391 TaxID=2731692 RepID=UPI00164FB4D8|nr:DUF1707 domain-containing protein [Actinomadura sp. HBU206391]MBC6460915.1 DUF1707 domain-containing protein [Actinomadura sp. HBU206391]